MPNFYVSMFIVKTYLKTASCSHYFRYLRMGASESIEVEEHLKVKACVKDSNGYSNNTDEEMHRKYKYKGEITKIPKFELRAQAKNIQGQNAVAMKK